MKPKSLAALILLVASTSMATPPEAGANETHVAAEKVLQQKLLRPLAAKDDEHSKFSRARLPPQERRVRMQQAAVDATGATFVTFAVDSRHGFADTEDAWNTDSIVGCVYLERSEVFIRRGDEIRPAAMLLGKKTKAAPAATCKAAAGTATASATAAPATAAPATAAPATAAPATAAPATATVDG